MTMPFKKFSLDSFNPWRIIIPLAALIFAYELYWMARIAIKVAVWLFR